MFIIDCSVTMAWIFEDEKTKKTEQLLNDIVTGQTAIVPSLWLLEVSNTLLIGERRGRLTQLQVSQFWKTLEALDIEVHDLTNLQNAEALIHLSREHQLTAYDAAYLNLAIQSNYPLATLDKQLLKAAKECGIKIV